MTQVLWDFEENRVVHTSGFAIVVQKGSFSEPYRIHVTGGDALSAVEHAGLVREGVAFGAALENSTERPLEKPVNIVIDQPTEAVIPPPAAGPSVTYKRRRSVRKIPISHEIGP